jgi:hypothetical protein
LVVAGAVAAMALLSNGAHWSPRMLVAQSAANTACGEADTSAGKVNFACDPSTQRILWVLASVTSENNSDFNGQRWQGLVRDHDPAAGKLRVGLVPMVPAEGAQMYPLFVKSLEAKSPSTANGYNPQDPVSSILVAAQAINNMIAGGYGIDPKTGAPGNIRGFEYYGSACQAYTGSDEQTTQFGLRVCKQPIIPEGYLPLVRDIVTQFVGKNRPDLVQDALTLFEHPDPGNQETQLVLRQLHLDS